MVPFYFVFASPIAINLILVTTVRYTTFLTTPNGQTTFKHIGYGHEIRFTSLKKEVHITYNVRPSLDRCCLHCNYLMPLALTITSSPLVSKLLASKITSFRLEIKPLQFLVLFLHQSLNIL